MGRRAIGIVRVSQVAGRGGPGFASPAVQRDRVQTECERQGLTLIAVHEELDISGGADLKDRPGLGPAVQAVEAGQADVIVGAYFDRFFRSFEVQAQVIRRVEAAGGQVLAVDFGVVSHATATQWLSASQTALMAEYYKRVGTEKTAEAIQRAIDRGVPPWPRVTAGYERQPNGVYAPHPRHAPAVSAAFQRRAQGATVAQVRQHLADHGVLLSYPGTVKLLRSRVVLGELHFGQFAANLAAHEPIVDRAAWEAVQRTRVPSGRNSKNPRLLARLGVLRCGTCDSRLVVNMTIGAGGGRYPNYRCQNTDCGRRVTISAPAAERDVVDAVRAAMGDIEGRATLEANTRAAEHELEEAERALRAGIRNLAVVEDEPDVQARLLELRAARDAARGRVDGLLGRSAAVKVTAADWQRLSFDGQRALVRATVARAVVRPGGGSGRVLVEFVE